MADIPGTTRAQTRFLRAFRANPFGPPPQHWPSPTILRRWLRRPVFCQCLRELRCALRVQVDFHLAAADAHAALRLAQPPDNAAHWTARDSIDTLRLAHRRERYGRAIPGAAPPVESDI